MQVHSEHPGRTFSIGSCEPDYNEARHAGAVAQYLGTEHIELYVAPTEAMEVVPRLPEMYDEPFADSSQIVTFLIARLARQDVTVCLPGDGGMRSSEDTTATFGMAVSGSPSNGYRAVFSWQPRRISRGFPGSRNSIEPKKLKRTRDTVVSPWS
jgi:Asparagine synthase